MSFTDEEIAYLRSQPLARLATVSENGQRPPLAGATPAQPDVVPVAFEYDGTDFWVGGVGEQVMTTRKFRNIATGAPALVALVVDDLVSFDPFVARGIRVYGRAEPPVERVGMTGPGYYSRITPTMSWSWNLGGKPAGEQWYATRRAVHRAG